MTRKNIVLFGAGKSATVLIDYILKRSDVMATTLTVVDTNWDLIQSKTGNHKNAIAKLFDIENEEERKQVIAIADIVISMLPPALHYLVAKDCILHRKNLLTASYIDENIRNLSQDISANSLLFLCEMGLDPGIDHMSAMQLINKIEQDGCAIKSFKSHCGGLVAPESDSNPWHYKISWNPANIVNAGKAGALYKYNHGLIKLGYKEIFKNVQFVDVPGFGKYAAYANRNSIPYISLYNLEGVETFIRTTLRHPDFCKGWYYITLAGLTENDLNKNFTNRLIKDWFSIHLKYNFGVNSFSDFLKVCVPPQDQSLINKLFTYLGITSSEVIPEYLSSHAAILQYLLEKNLQLMPDDKDMVIMMHEIDYVKQNIVQHIRSCLVVKGENNRYTAMAKTVGLPLAVAAELILNNNITLTGLHIPTHKSIYTPVLNELANNGIEFYDLIG